MAIIRWDPWAELSAWERQLGSLFGRPEGREQGSRGWAPPLDVHQEGDAMVICAEVPGIDPADLDISVEDDVLTLSGHRDDHREVQEGDWIRRERYSGHFQRTVHLPPGVDPATIEASATNGMIQIRVPRPAVASGRHKVQLHGGNGRSAPVDVDSGPSGQPTQGGPDTAGYPTVSGGSESSASPTTSGDQIASGGSKSSAPGGDQPSR